MRNLFVAVSVLFLISCSSEKAKKEGELSYNFIEDKEGKSASLGDWVVFTMTIKDANDSVMFASNIEQVRNNPYMINNESPAVDNALLQSSPGDSVTFDVKAEDLYTRIPNNLKPEDVVNVSFRVDEVIYLDELKKKEAKEIEAYLQENSLTSTVTESGIHYIKTEEGSGRKIKEGDFAKIHYIGTKLDGTEFDQSYKRGQPFEFQVGKGRVIKGWDEGVQKMTVGEKATLIIPSYLAYGPVKRSEVITANSILRFDMEVVEASSQQDDILSYLSENKLEGTKTESGLYYAITEKGSGKQAEAGKKVKVHYAGFLLDGTKFDSSFDRGEPIEFMLGSGQVIKGWDEGIALLKEGDKAQFLIPSDLAYGPRGAGKVIPPNAVLRFEVELIEVMDK